MTPRREVMAAALLGTAVASCGLPPPTPLPSPLRVESVAPAPPGPIAPDARFAVEFSGPVPAAQLGEAGLTDGAVLVRARDADRIAAALKRGHLGARLKLLVLPAEAQLEGRGQRLLLVPEQPLPDGEVELLISGRLKDAQGQKIAGPESFSYTVREASAP